MGIVDVKRAFIAGLGGKGSCTSATMKYEPDDSGAPQNQRLTFTVIRPDGTPQTLSEVFPPRADLVAKARELGEQFAAALNGS